MVRREREKTRFKGVRTLQPAKEKGCEQVLRVLTKGWEGEERAHFAWQRFIAICCCLFAKSCMILTTPWTVACQAPLSVGFPRQGYGQEWIAICFSRGSPQSRDWTHVSCFDRWILYHWATRDAFIMMVAIIKVILFFSLLPMCQLGRDYFKQDTTTTNLLWILNSDIFLEGWECGRMWK